MKKSLKNKSGISLIVLVIMVVVSLILLSLGILAIDKNVKNSSVAGFANDLKEIEDASGSYYIEYGKSYFTDIKTKSEILALVTDNMRVEFEDELLSNSDNEETTFYVVDLAKIGVVKSTRGNAVKIYEEESNDIYVLASKTLHAYYLKGINVGGINYFSISQKIKNLL